MKILIADDEPSVRSAISLLLYQHLGITAVIEAKNTQSALTITAKQHPDIILLDWELPESGGAPAIEALRDQAPQLIIIVLSGRPEVRATALASGANAFVSKGKPPEVLIRTLCKHFPTIKPTNANHKLTIQKHCKTLNLKSRAYL